MTGPRYVSSISLTVTRSTYVYSLFDLQNSGPLFISNCSPVSLLYGGPLHTNLFLNVVAHFVSRPVWTLGLSPRNIN